MNEPMIEVTTTAFDDYVASGVHPPYYLRVTVRRPMSEVVQALVNQSNLRYTEERTVPGNYSLKAGG